MKTNNPNASARSEGKSLVAIIVIIILIIAGIAWVFADSSRGEIEYTDAVPATTTSNSVSDAGANDVAGSSTMAYTLADLASHKDAKSCWVAIDGSVYDMTSFIGQHPGGDVAILSLCGRDGSEDFHEEHGMGGPQQQAVFTKYKVGVLTK